MDLEEFQDHLGYTFRDISLLNTALSRCTPHESEMALAQEHVGDSLTSLVIRDFIARRFGRRDIAFYKALITNSCMIVVARRIKVQQASYGFRNFGYHITSKTIANLLEAVIGAIYQDGGFNAAQDFVLRTFPLQAVLVHGEVPCRVKNEKNALIALEGYKENKTLIKQALTNSPYKASIDYHIKQLRTKNANFSASSLLYEIEMASRWPMFFQPNTIVEQVNAVYGAPRSIENNFASL